MSWLLGLFIVSYIQHIFNICLYLLIIFFDINYYVFDGVSDSENTEQMIEYISKNCNNISLNYLKNGEKLPSGLCFSHKDGYIAYIFNSNITEHNRCKVNSTIYYLGNLHIDLKKSNISSEDKEKINTISIWDKDDDYRDSYVHKLTIPFNKEPYEKQTLIIDKIRDFYQNNDDNYCRTLVYGQPGKGKSYIGKLLANQLNGELATYINLVTPGCGFKRLYKKANPTKDKPLIIQIDELDIIISKVHNETIKKEHDWLEIACMNKITYNNFWSEIVPNYPYVIWLCTMNSLPESIDKMNTCYIRKNRMDLVMEY